MTVLFQMMDEIGDPYEPSRPNNYEQFCREREIEERNAKNGRRKKKRCFAVGIYC